MTAATRILARDESDARRARDCFGCSAGTVLQRIHKGADWRLEDVEDGEKLTATGIRAFGPATVTMPDKAAIESCIAQKLKPDEAKDEDIVATVLGSCAEAAPSSKEPIAIKATVEIGIYDPPSADVELTRTFLEPSALPSGALKVETTPANCNVSN